MCTLRRFIPMQFKLALDSSVVEQFEQLSREKPLSFLQIFFLIVLMVIASLFLEILFSNKYFRVLSDKNIF